ncbi:MAG: single-stranded-DNA-specific exonuclease RecJ [Chloroflexi bacterium]|nr:single-stranded-DNA-specific exonuclease RecJ [Chloroflexota bacterium]
MTSKTWKLLPQCPPGLLCQADGVHPLLVQLLYNRGLRNAAEFGLFLSCDRSLSNDPLTLPDMPRAVERIFQALFRGEKIAVFGDFDADGVTATVLLVECLQSMGGDVVPYIPHRSDEGHGLNGQALQELARQGVSLVVTVDCGITSAAEVEAARRLGADVVITDHHTVSGPVPRACAVVDPKRPDSAYAYPDLAGVGVAFKLAQALAAGRESGKLMESLLGLVAIGTVADMSPLSGENRFLVSRGLDELNSTSRPGIIAMLKAAGMMPGKISANSIAWDLAPRLNAAGRIEHSWTSYHLLHTGSEAEAEQKAVQLEGINRERQSLLETHWNRAREMVLAEQVGKDMLLVCSPEFPPGICGLVASRLVDEFRRPSIVVQLLDDSARGSCRTIPQYDIIAALTASADLFNQFGGHPAAAGFSMDRANLERLRERLLADAAQKLAGVDASPVLVIDAEVDPSVLTGSVLAALQQLAPYGQGNRAPMFMCSSANVLEARKVGSAGQHLKMKLKCSGKTWPAIGFGLGDRAQDIRGPIDIAYFSQISRWNGTESLELNIADFRPA